MSECAGLKDLTFDSFDQTLTFLVEKTFKKSNR